MKGVILAGGLGTKLYPLTYLTNKHLLPVYDKPAIYYPIQALAKAGIKDVMVVIGGPHASHFMNILRNFKNWGLNHVDFTYQTEPAGIADALRLCEDFAQEDNLVVILGDNCFDFDISRAMRDFKEGAMVFLKETTDTRDFGVPHFDKNGQIIAIEEKPKDPKSPYAVTGIYIYDNKVFDFIRTIKPSTRGELEITDVNNCYIKQGDLYHTEIKGFWSDTGTFDGLFKANEYWAKKTKRIQAKRRRK